MAEIRGSSCITGYSYREWTGRWDVSVTVDRASQRAVAAMLIHRLPGGVSELAVVFVLEEFRGFGLAKQLIRFGLRTMRGDGRTKIIFYSDDQMHLIVTAAGFTTYPSLADYCAYQWSRRLYYTAMYKPVWLLNTYRIREMARKRRELGSGFDFRIGVIERGEPQ
jgi:GNAT superfamily N-acetyltransferase